MLHAVIFQLIRFVQKCEMYNEINSVLHLVCLSILVMGIDASALPVDRWLTEILTENGTEFNNKIGNITWSAENKWRKERERDMQPIKAEST